MVDSLSSTGLLVKTRTELVTDLTAGMKSIFGSDINVDSNSPDGQLIGIIAQAATDIRELLLSINAGFDPDQALGTLLDQRVTINNIARNAGSYTVQPVELVISSTVTLTGLDANYNSPTGAGFTVQDNAGNQFILIDTATLAAGTYTKNFRAKNIGATLTTINTITTAVTVVIGVTGINNPSSALTTGTNEETDAQLRIRRQQSVALSSNGYLNGLLGTILNLNGVTDAKVYENVTDSVDADGIPAHGIWVITDEGANTDIANAIYSKKSYGCNMKGAVSVNITTASGDIFVALFDRPTAENLHIRFDIQKTISTATFDLPAIKAYLVANLIYKIGQFAETSSVTTTAATAINSISAGGVPINMEISKDGAAWYDYLTTTTLDKKFALATARITITVL